MIDNKLLLHLLKNEVRWKIRLMPWSLFFVISSFPLHWIRLRYQLDVALYATLCGVLPLLLFAISESLAINSANQNQVVQSGGFSWKYLHTLIHDRKKFVLSFALVGALLILPLTVYGIIVLYIYRINIIIGVMCVPSMLLIASLSRISFIYNSIQFPRRTYYSYHSGSPLIQFLKGVANGFHRCLHFGAMLCASIIFIIIMMEVNDLYIFPSVTLVLLIFNILLFKTTLKIWQDERFSKWSIRRNALKTLIYLAIFFGIIVIGVNQNKNIFCDIHKDLFYFIKNGQLAEIKKIEITPEILEKRIQQRTALHEAVYRKQLPIVKYFLEKGANQKTVMKGWNVKPQSYQNGMNALMLAVDVDALDIAKYLIENGADVNSVNVSKASALSIAAYRCNSDMVKLLIDNGANVDAVDNDRKTPLFYAARKGCIVPVLMLEKYGANTRLKNNNNQTYLEYANVENPIFLREYYNFKQLAE